MIEWFFYFPLSLNGLGQFFWGNYQLNSFLSVKLFQAGEPCFFLGDSSFFKEKGANLPSIDLERISSRIQKAKNQALQAPKN